MGKHVFLSFVAEDLDAVNLFRGQAKNRNSALVFADYSVKTPYNSTNAAYIRSQITEKIRDASVTICLIGPSTAASDWVAWEIEKSVQLGNKVIGVKLYSTVNCPTPAALTAARATIHEWKITDVVGAIG
ncbi:TIR domain-containing protein [Salinibacterium sp. NSLL150]|uniref:TIR domain-containing protein n=1 Tax=unclassified Salinibacterium TaxID=2632331 RepID=UPI0018CE7CFE|nr:MULTISPECIES: TIR domain-containing protein [unclassified Salinibacterium]MBH0098778.1 TIR domain-containing protein [Salinibacterium sp. NSLL35]MBH0101533.1 TIR domain-containing protein [Salinibacterium sp. NSLL150]MBH0104292.1 TIR domain-containing protein [Salinibacterium sp. NSLL16]MBH0107053.1 TIR domain-containing protein [Salinibacterium sp. NSLL17]